MPASEFEFDKTRNAINANKISDEERKKMLDKFKESGGKVLDDNEIKKEQDSNTRSGKTIGNIDRNQQLPSEKYKEQRRQEAQAKIEHQKKIKNQEDAHRSTSRLFKLKIVSFFKNITFFSKKILKPKMVNLIGQRYSVALTDINLHITSLLYGNKKIGIKITSSLDNVDPILIEVLLKLKDLYQQDNLQALQNKEGQSIDLSTIIKPLKSLYLQLYYIQAYRESSIKALSMAFNIYKKEGGDNIENLQKKSNIMLKYINLIFDIVLPSLHLAISRADDIYYPNRGKYLEKNIGFSIQDTLGQREKGTNIFLKEEDAEEVAPQEETETKAEEKEPVNPILLSKEYKYGLSIMQNQNLLNLRKKIAFNHTIDTLKISDKCLITYLFYFLFEHEYSFLLTSKKIQLDFDFSTGAKVSYYDILNDIYNESHSVIRKFEEYCNFYKEHEKVISDKATQSSRNSLSYSKLKDSSSNKLQGLSSVFRNSVSHYMDKIQIKFIQLIQDMKGQQEIVKNQNDILKIDENIEGKKRLHNHKVQDCIIETYCYSVALKERLSNEDLLGGTLEFTPDEMQDIFGVTIEPNNTTNSMPY